MHLRSRRRDQDVEKYRPLTPHYILSVARGPDLAKVQSLIELCGLRVNVETYNTSKGPLQCKRCHRFGHTQHNYGYAPRGVTCGDAQPSEQYVTPKQQLNCCSCGGNHTANYRGCSKWNESKRPLQSEHKLSAAEGMVFPLVCTHRGRLHLCQLLNRRHLVLAGTTLSKGAVLSKLTLLPLEPPPHPIWTSGPSGRLSTLTASVSPLVLRRRW
jgi:hypothetical protein